ncbi:MAG: hypothetical protein AABW91_03940 [Nanoarchaeota archaeon]
MEYDKIKPGQFYWFNSDGSEPKNKERKEIAYIWGVNKERVIFESNNQISSTQNCETFIKEFIPNRDINSSEISDLTKEWVNNLVAILGRKISEK